MKLHKVSGIFFAGIFSFFLMTNIVSAAWEDRTDPVWWPGTWYGAYWDGTKWDAGSYEVLLRADPNDDGSSGPLAGSTFAGERPTKVRVIHTNAPTYLSVDRVGGGASMAGDGSYVSGTELDMTYSTNEDIGRLYFGGSGITAIEFFFPDPPGEIDGVNLSVTIDENITLDCGNDVDIDGGTVIVPGIPMANSTTCTVTTNDADGYNLQIADDNGVTNALENGSHSITDKTAWNPSSPNAVAWTGAGLGFSVYSSTATKNTAWWGTGTSCHDANNLYAGLPDVDMNIVEHASFEGVATTTDICYRVDVPLTQASGEYTGSVTYTAVGRP